MRVKELTYQYNGKTYPVIITKKRMKNITYRYKEGTFYISVPWFYLKNEVINGLDKYAERLIKSEKKSLARGDNYIYLLGERIELNDTHQLVIPDGTIIVYKDEVDLDKKLKKWFLNLIKMRVAYYTNMMKVESYKVRVQKMSSRFGSNSKHTKSLNFSLILMHYSIDIIDSVVVHELAHILVYNHSKEFYDVVYKYCPNYDVCHLKLRKGIFQ